MSVMKIDILMATYNGSHYVAQQIRSLQNQTHEEWDLWVHDDGSADDTVKIVKDMACCDKRIHVVEDGIRLHSPAWNFMHLLALSKAEYAIFCDQDDIWLENKLEVLLNVMLKSDQSLPQAVYGNGYVYHAPTGEIVGRALLSTPRHLGETLFANGGVQGCALLINSRLRSICLDTPSNICMHDHLVTLAALTFGHLTYVDIPLMLYRRHAETVTDVQAASFGEKLRLFVRNRKPVLDRRHVEAIRDFVSHYDKSIPQEKRRLFDAFLILTRYSKFRAFLTVLSEPFSLYGSKILLLLKLFVRPLV